IPLDGYRTPMSDYDEKCIDIYNGPYEGPLTTDGAVVLSAPCNKQGRQMFALIPNHDGFAQMVFKHSGKCLQAMGGGWMAQMTCDPTNLGQKFYFAAQTAGTYSVHVQATGYCLDVSDS